MKRARTGLLCMLLLAVFCLIPAKSTQAATAKRLFTITINDGFVSQKVPVYQYTESGGSFTVAAKKTLRTLPVYAGAKTVRISIGSKTSLYKNTYKSVTYKKKATLSGTTSLKLTLKTKAGASKTMTVKLIRPSMPKISSLKTSASTFTPGNYARLSVKLNMKAGVAVKAYYKVKNSSGKVVYQKILGTRKSTNYTAYWDGRPSKGNAAGLSASDYVPAGTYKLTAYLQYTVGGKNKFISKTVTVKIKRASSGTSGTAGGNGAGDSPAGGTGVGTATDNPAFRATAWKWKVTLSGDDTLDFMAEQICQQVLTSSMSETERARALFVWCVKNFTYLGSNINTKTSQSQVDQIAASAACVAYAKQADTQIATGKAAVNWTDGYFGSKEGSGMHKTKMGWTKAGLIQKKGNCLVLSCIYQTLLRHAGIEAHIVENPSGSGHHFWNVVKIGSKYYYCDVNKGFYDSDPDKKTFFLRGTNFEDSQWARVRKNESKYAIAQKVSAADCPGR